MATSASGILAGDLVADGDMDLGAAANIGGGGNEYPDNGEGGMVDWYRNDGTGTFTKMPVTLGNSTGLDGFDWIALSAWAGVFNCDGGRDIAFASFDLKHQGSMSLVRRS